MGNEHEVSMLEGEAEKESLNDESQCTRTIPEEEQGDCGILDNFSQLLEHLPEGSLSAQLVQKKIELGEKFSEEDVRKLLRKRFSEVRQGYE